VKAILLAAVVRLARVGPIWCAYSPKEDGIGRGVRSPTLKKRGTQEARSFEGDSYPTEGGGNLLKPLFKRSGRRDWERVSNGSGREKTHLICRSRREGDKSTGI